MKYPILIMFGALVAAISFAGYRHSKKNNREKQVENCGLEDIKKWFSHRSELLEGGTAIVMKQGADYDENIILSHSDLYLAVVDKNSSKIFDHGIFKCTKISNELILLFGNKDMIVLK